MLKGVDPIGGWVETRDEEKTSSHGGKDVDVFFGRVFVVVVRWGGLLLDRFVGAYLGKLATNKFLCIVVYDGFWYAVSLYEGL